MNSQQLRWRLHLPQVSLVLEKHPFEWNGSVFYITRICLASSSSQLPKRVYSGTLTWSSYVAAVLWVIQASLILLFLGNVKSLSQPPGNHWSFDTRSPDCPAGEMLTDGLALWTFWGCRQTVTGSRQESPGVSKCSFPAVSILGWKRKHTFCELFPADWDTEEWACLIIIIVRDPEGRSGILPLWRRITGDGEEERVL